MDKHLYGHIKRRRDPKTWVVVTFAKNAVICVVQEVNVMEYSLSVNVSSTIERLAVNTCTALSSHLGKEIT